MLDASLILVLVLAPAPSGFRIVAAHRRLLKGIIIVDVARRVISTNLYIVRNILPRQVLPRSTVLLLDRVRNRDFVYHIYDTM